VRRLREQGGFSIVPAIATLGLMLMLGGVAVQEAVNALTHARKEESVKRALQSADAAIDAAVFALNRADLGSSINIDPLHPESVANQTCLSGTGSVGATETAQGVAGSLQMVPLPAGTLPDPSGKRWCPETRAESAHDGSATSDAGSTTWTYRVSELARVGAESCAGTGVLSLDREIVAVAQSRDRVRRVRTRLRASVPLLSGAAVQSASSTSPMTMAGTARVLGNATSNHDIAGAVTNVISGNGIPGPGRSVTGVIPVGTRTAACSKFVLPEVDPGTTSTTNSNASIATSCVSALLVVTACKPLLTVLGGVDAVAATKPVLHVWGTGRAILTGTDFSFCSIRLEGSAVLQIPAASAITRIFLRDPAECSGVANAGQIVMDGSAKIVNCHLQTQPQSLQLYAKGSSTTATTQTIAGGGTVTSALMTTACGSAISLTGVPMVVYAPHSRVELGGTTAIAGQVAGSTVAMSGAAAVQPVNALVNLNQLGARPVLPLYQPIDYVECTGKTFAQLPPENPAQGC
jgi:type II secretory pathway pseudopilin PulG